VGKRGRSVALEVEEVFYWRFGRRILNKVTENVLQEGRTHHSEGRGSFGKTTNLASQQRRKRRRGET